MKLLFRIILTLIAVIALLTAYSRYIEPYRLTVREIPVVNKNISGASDVTIAVFADTHFGDYYTPKNFERVIDTVNSRDPDIILFCGDLIDNFRAYSGSADAIAEALAQLSATIGKYAVYGNHDYGGGAESAYSDIMAAGGFTILKNESVEFEAVDLELIGLDDFLLGSGDAGYACDAAKKDRFNLVFCHEPDVAGSLLDYNIDFMAAGHTHGGQVNIPGYKHTFFPPLGHNYQKGVYLFDNEAQTVLYVNSGIGTTMMPFRFMAPPEVSFITLHL